MSGLTKLGVLVSVLFLIGCTAKHEGHHHHGHHHDHHHDHGHAHGHGHDHTPHLGTMAPLRSAAEEMGFAELKLHDDKGDLELWLTNDEAGTKPFDLPLNTVITVSFPELDQTPVQLRIRNSENNEDEQGKGNIRNNRTNYFIFPGETGADASFLVGKDFVAETIITFTSEGGTYTTAPFTLRPHTH